MGICVANPEKIIYSGRWENVETGKHSVYDFTKAFLMFRGDSIKIVADGKFLVSLDGGPDVEESEIKTENGLHSLVITAMAETTIYSVEAEELLVPDVYFRSAMRAELEEIKNDREAPHSSKYNKIEFAAKMPSSNVKLKGFFGEIFNRSVERIKICAKYPYHLAAYEWQEKVSTGWADWLPGAQDGRILAGAAKSYLWTGDEELKAIVDRVVDEIAAHTDADGYSNYNPVEKAFGNVFVPNQKNELQTLMDSELKNFDRIFWTYGMVAAVSIGSEKASKLVREMYDWLASSEYRKTLLFGHNATNSQTAHLLLALSEAGLAKDLEFHQKYLDLDIIQKEFANKNPLIFSNFPLDRPHCYVLLNVVAAAMEYQLTGDKYYLDIALGGWDIYNRYFKCLGGITGICESDGPYMPGSYQVSNHIGETCGSVFWVWLNAILAQLFPNEEKYCAEIEEVLFNVVPTVLTPKMKIRYHNRMQGTKDSGSSVGTCCEVMATNLYGDLPKYVCSYNDSTIYINQYISADIDTGDTAITTDADVFGEKKFTVTVTKASAAKKCINVRIPAWARYAKVYLNGEFIGDAEGGSFKAFERVFANGDTITVTFTPERKTVRYTGTEQINGGNPIHQGPPRYAFVYGPCLMAVTGEKLSSDVPVLAVDPITLEPEYTSENSVTFKVNDDLKFVPYHEIDTERFSTYAGYKVQMQAEHFNTAGAN